MRAVLKIDVLKIFTKLTGKLWSSGVSLIKKRPNIFYHYTSQ